MYIQKMQQQQITDDNLSELFNKQLNLKSDDKCMETPNIDQKPTLRTEDTGKMFEMAICKAYNITYHGKYKYSYELAERLCSRLQTSLTTLFPQCEHTAADRSPYDFTAVENQELHLSAKTVKRGAAKVAPQVIGQASPKTLCTHLNTIYTTDLELKCYIQGNITQVLDLMTKHTFGCPNIYFHQQKNTIKYVTMTEPIDWSTYTYTWTKDWQQWNNSTICKIQPPSGGKPVSIAEFQFHTKSRKNMAIRWYYDNFLEVFKHHLDVVNM
jgi:hypothetical protein